MAMTTVPIFFGIASGSSERRTVRERDNRWEMNSWVRKTPSFPIKTRSGETTIKSFKRFRSLRSVRIDVPQSTMKIFVAFLLIGLASASFLPLELDDTPHELEKNERSADDIGEDAFADLNFRDILEKIREHLKKNVDPELLKEKIEKLFDQGSEILRHLLRVLKEKGKRKLEILIDALLDEDDEDRESRSIKDYWEKVKDYFKDLKIDLQEKYMKFGEWVKNVIDKGMERSKDKMENIKAIAREFAKHAKNVSKEVGAEASEFFRQYKDELGNIWEELKEAFKQIRNRDE